MDFGAVEKSSYSFFEGVVRELGLVTANEADYLNRYLLFSHLSEVKQAQLIICLRENKRTAIWFSDTREDFPDHPADWRDLPRVEVKNYRFALLGHLNNRLQEAMPVWVWAMERIGEFQAEDVRQAMSGVSPQQVSAWLALLRRRKLVASRGRGGGTFYRRLHPEDMTPFAMQQEPSSL